MDVLIQSFEYDQRRDRCDEPVGFTRAQKLVAVFFGKGFQALDLLLRPVGADHVPFRSVPGRDVVVDAFEDHPVDAVIQRHLGALADEPPDEGEPVVNRTGRVGVGVRDLRRVECRGNKAIGRNAEFGQDGQVVHGVEVEVIPARLVRDVPQERVVR